MHLLTPATAERYLRERGELEAAESVRISELAGGVSNEVLLIERSRGDRFVLKQAREQLRVEQEWKCDVRRIWREMDVLRLCGEVLRDAKVGTETGITACVPEILFEDRGNYCYAMTAAPPAHKTWKDQLLSGELQVALALVIGQVLGTLHARTLNDGDVAKSLADASYFNALRIEPYYVRTAEVHPELRDRLQDLTDSMQQHRSSLVHGDFSPKNLLISLRCVTLIDFEVGHFGDPAFDNGFFLSHLFLKAIHQNSLLGQYAKAIEHCWLRYRNTVSQGISWSEAEELEKRSVSHLAGCLLARIDGKSPVDYLNTHEQEQARALGTSLLRSAPHSLADAIRTLQQ